MKLYTMRWIVILLGLWSLTCPAAGVKTELKAEITVRAAWDELANFFSSHERDVLKWCHCELLTTDEAMEFTANAPREIRVSLPKHKPIHLTMIATMANKDGWASWEMRLQKPGGGLKSYELKAHLTEAKDHGATTIHIEATAESDGRWKRWELAAGLSRMVRGVEAGMRKQFSGEKR